jgi:broad specificity phosphatase PhoE
MPGFLNLSDATQTAQLILARTEPKIVLDGRLRERALGSLEGQTSNPSIWHNLPADVEPLQTIEARTLAFWDDMLASVVPGSRILCVTHGGTIKIMSQALQRRAGYTTLLGRRAMATVHPANCSLTQFTLSRRDDGWRGTMDFAGQVDHLTERHTSTNTADIVE